MAGVIRVQNLQCGVYPVGFVEPNPGVSFIFCNGIGNDVEDAQESGMAISQALTSQRVTVFHNPTTFANYKDRSIEQLRMQSAISNQFAKLIRDEIRRHQQARIADRDIRIILFVHSHGAVVARRALDRLSESERNKVEVFAFGGATMIPNNRARVARNFVREADLIAKAGNIRDPRNIFSKVLSVHRAKSNGRTLGQAIDKISSDELRQKIDPNSNLYHRDYEQICERYERIFERRDQQALEQDPDFIQLKAHNRQLFQDYDIHILEKVPLSEPNYTPIERHTNVREFAGNLGWNLFAMVGNAVEWATCAYQVVDKNHTFEEYLPQVRAVVEELEVD